MSQDVGTFDREAALARLDSARSAGQLLDVPAKAIRQWLTEPLYHDYAPVVADHLAEARWDDLNAAFLEVLPFGTGGRRGRMYPIGTNRINAMTIAESAQGLANYLRQQYGPEAELRAALAYDPRHNSRHFAEICAEVLVAAGFTVFFLDDYRSTPALSFTVRDKQCHGGIMVTASHNPPSDNAVKVYGPHGGQIVPPHDKAVIEYVQKVTEIRRTPFQNGLDQGKIRIVTAEIDDAYADAAVACGFPGPRDAAILYTPLHGVGESAVRPLLEKAGFANLTIYGPHREPSGDFPNVPGNVSNPENAVVFDAPVVEAKRIGAQVVLATDPDCDRMGAAAPKVAKEPGGDWATLSGNQLGALLVDYILDRRKAAGTLSKDHYVVKTLVTTDMIRRIDDSYGVRTEGNLNVGFKWIGELVDQLGSEKFVFGTEESHGYLVGQYARDKDGAVACLLLSELVARLAAEGKSLHEKLDDLYWQFGLHTERLMNLALEDGEPGRRRRDAMMAAFRAGALDSLAGMPFARRIDYQNKTVHPSADASKIGTWPPKADFIAMDFAEAGNKLAVRPSGTENKVKFYMFAYTPAEQLHDLDRAKQDHIRRLDTIEEDLREFVDQLVPA